MDNTDAMIVYLEGIREDAMCLYTCTTTGAGVKGVWFEP